MQNIEATGTIVSLDGGSTNLRASVVKFPLSGSAVYDISTQWFNALVDTHGGLSVYPEVASDALITHLHGVSRQADAFTLTGAYKNPVGIDGLVIAGQVELNGSTASILQRVAAIVGIGVDKLPADILTRPITKLISFLETEEFASFAPIIGQNTQLSTRLGLLGALLSGREPIIPACDIEGFTLGVSGINQVMTQLNLPNYGYTEEDIRAIDGRVVHVSGDYPTTLEFISQLNETGVIWIEGDSFMKFAIPKQLATSKDNVANQIRFGMKTGKESFGAVVNRGNKEILLPFVDKNKLNDPNNPHYIYEEISSAIEYTVLNFNLNHAEIYFLPVDGGHHLVRKGDRLYRAKPVDFQENKSTAQYVIALRDLGVGYKVMSNLDPNPPTPRKVGFYSGMFAIWQQKGNQMIFCAALPENYDPYLYDLPDSGVMAAFSVARKQYGRNFNPRSVMKSMRLPYKTNAYPDYHRRWLDIFTQYHTSEDILELPELSRQ